MNGKRKRRKSNRYTQIKHHKKRGSKLKTPLTDLNTQTIAWDRDFLPEHLWIAALAEHFGIESFHNHYNEFLNMVDEFWPHDFVAFGLISDFGLIPQEARTKMIQKNTDIINELFHVPIARILAFYPDCPASWLLDQRLIEKEGPLDPEVELGRLRSIVVKLLPGKDHFSARVRAVPLNRLFKNNKILLNKGMPVIDLLPKYPIGLSEDEQQHVEAFARTAMNVQFHLRKDFNRLEWPKYFWRHNYDLVTCKAHEKKLIEWQTINKEKYEILLNRLEKNVEITKNYLSLLHQKIRPDLYDPTRDEVLCGLFARLTRLHNLLTENPHLWSKDVGSIMLRCLADTAITFSYLVLSASPDEFNKFVEYGEGQQKLLMLHLQDNYPEDTSLEGLTSEELAERMGVYPEMLDIELGHWTKKDARRLASEAGMEKLYRLVYSPTSGELHGSWLSLKDSNLTICEEPLHRYHRIPSYAEPPLFVSIGETTKELYEFCRKLASEKLGYPEPTELLESLL